MLYIARLCILSVFITAVCPLYAASVVVDGASGGRTFDGIGAVSAGANSRLLIDYAEPYRSDILDLLFKPKYGASFHHLKVELGGGTNSTSGAEPSHVSHRSELSDPVSRGYEFWLMKAARDRNPNIVLDFLPWSFPYWLGTPFGQKQDYADYFTAFMIEARDQWGVTVDWVSAAKNESYTDLDWIANYLRPTMDAAGFADVKIQAPDGHSSQNWNSFWDIVNNPTYNAVIDAIGYHYIDQENIYPTAEMIATGKTMWDSEDSVGSGDWTNGREIVRRMNKLYTNGRLTQMQIWCPIDSCADGVMLTDVGVMKGDTPWSGYYHTRPATWCVAHYTQFTEPGWVFVDSGCGFLGGQGNFATLKNPVTGDWSMVIYSETAEPLTVTLTGGLPSSRVYVWKSTSASQFIRQADIIPSGGSFTLNLSDESIYTLTTTTGQQKGAAANPVPPYSDFPFPYAEDFESYAVGATPKWISDMQGTFEVAACKGGRPGQCLQQILPQIGNTWVFDWVNPHAPMTLFGSMDWENYEFSADVFIDSGEVYLAVRKGEHQRLCGYAFVLDKGGNWRLSLDNITDPARTLASGSIGGFDGSAWHNIKVRAIHDQIDAYVNNIRVTSVIDGTRAKGQPCLGGSFGLNQYDNLHVYAAGPGGSLWQMTDDLDGSLSWINWWGTWASGVYYGGTCKYSENAGSAVEFPFYGKVARVLGSRRNDLGFLDVYLDGVLQTSVDCYSPTTIDSTVLYETPELALDNHLLRLVVSGQHHPDSIGFEIVLDAFSSSETGPGGWCPASPIDTPAPPVNLALSATASASSRWSRDYSAARANDGNWNTRWNSAAGDVNGAWLQLDFNTPVTFGQARFSQFDNRIQSYKIQYDDNNQWIDAYTGGPMSTTPQTVTFAPVTAGRVRLLVVESTTVPSVYEFELYAPSSIRFRPLYVDVNADGVVDLADLAEMASVWLQDDCNQSCQCDRADLLHSGCVDMEDFAVLAGELLL
jgi:galactosylceramidase